MREKGIIIVGADLGFLHEHQQLICEMFEIMVIEDEVSPNGHEFLRAIDVPKMYEEVLKATKGNEFIDSKMKWKKERWQR